MVEIFNKGNLEEFPVQSMFHAWLYASQLSSALEYLETRDLVHSSVIEPFVYIASIKKVCELKFFAICHLLSTCAQNAETIIILCTDRRP